MTTPQKTTFIYGLWDPRNYQLRYIGKANNPQKRLKQHIQFAKSYKKNGKNLSYAYHWILQLLSENLEPSIEILEEVSIDDWQEAERTWISECRKFGLNITNISNGGDGTLYLTEKTKAAISKSLSGRPGREVSEEERKRMSEINPWRGKDGWMKGVTFTEEHKRKISESHIGDKNPMFGRKISQESIDKITSKTRGLKRSGEFRNHISQVQKGKVFTEDHKQKLKEAWIKRKEKFGNSGFRSESIEKMRESQKNRKDRTL